MSRSYIIIELETNQESVDLSKLIPAIDRQLKINDGRYRVTDTFGNMDIFSTKANERLGIPAPARVKADIAENARITELTNQLKENQNGKI